MNIFLIALALIVTLSTCFAGSVGVWVHSYSDENEEAATAYDALLPLTMVGTVIAVIGMLCGTSFPYEQTVLGWTIAYGVIALAFSLPTVYLSFKAGQLARKISASRHVSRSYS